MTTATITEPQRQQLCRLCAEPKASLVGIYEAEGRKLAIEAKIAKCLRIQVLATDCLPLHICTECCVLLDQSNEFYEKTNQAQSCLRRILLDTKSEHSQKTSSKPANVEQQLDYEKKIIDCDDNKNTEEFSVEMNNGAKKNNDEVPQKLKFQQIANNVKSEYQNDVDEKSLLKQNKKKVKKKNNVLVEEESEFKNVLADEVNEEYVNNTANKMSNVNISQNNVAETGSNLKTNIALKDTINSELYGDKEQKINRKKEESLDKYPWLCTDCNDKLPSLEALEEHHETVHNQKAKYMCVQCCKVYEKYYGFLTHVKRHKTKAKFSCDECGKTFVHKKVLDAHKAIHSEDRPHVCQTCGKAFRQQSALYIHSRCHLPENMKNRYPCDQCDKRFSTKPNLVTHKRIHSGVRNFTCDQCGKSFIQKGNLEAHFLTHSADKPYKCSQCPKTFKTPLQVKKHETVHTGAKPHECTICGRTFREKGTLREHHRIHTGAMPFSCEFCGKCFRFKGILTTHRRQHTGERPYSCLECQHHFTNWPNYNKHMKRRHGINTSQNKQHAQPSQQQQQEAQQHLESLQQQQQPTSNNTSCNSSNNNNNANGNNSSSNNVPHSLVIHTVPQVTVTTQPIVLQALPPSNATITGIQTFTETVDVPVTLVSVSQQPVASTMAVATAGGIQASTYRERQQHPAVPAATTYFNISTPLSNFLPPSLPYNFYNISNAGETDLVHHR